jgi:hypothetical protein
VPRHGRPQASDFDDEDRPGARPAAAAPAPAKPAAPGRKSAADELDALGEQQLAR